MFYEKGRAVKSTTVVPDRDTDVEYDALWVGGAGNIKYMLSQDKDWKVLSGVVAGTLLPFCFKRISDDADTTATLMIGLKVNPS